MHPLQVLPKIIQAWPYLVLPGTILHGTAETSIVPVLWGDIVYTFLMPIEVVDSTKTFSSIATRLFALIWPLVSADMFSVSSHS